MLKRLFAVLTCLVLYFVPSNAYCDTADLHLDIDADAVEHYVALMKYIKENNRSYFEKKISNLWGLFKKRDCFSEEEARQFLGKNKNDTVLNTKIDNLLSLPVYRELSRNQHSRTLNVDGIDAYKKTFYTLPWVRTRLSGSVDQIMLAFMEELSETIEDDTSSLVEHFSKPETSQKIFDTTDSYLAEEIPTADNVTTYMYFDGNRGSFTNGRQIYIDLRSHDISSSDHTILERIMSHELHHIYYGSWLENSCCSQEKIKAVGERKAALLEWQKQFLLEGTARFCDYVRLPAPIRSLYSNNELIATLFTEWERTFLGFYKNEISSDEYKALLNSYKNKYAHGLLKQYLSDLNDDEYKRCIPDRPVIHYYLGYFMFHTIYQAHGIDTFKSVMIHPENLLQVHNETIEGKTDTYRISDEMLTAWRELLAE